MNNDDLNSYGCNCRVPDDCPLDGNCLQCSVVYKAQVTQTDTNENESYIGMTGDTFKSRYLNHMKSIRNPKYKHETSLSSYVWKLKENGTNFKISWKVIDRGTVFNPTTNRCNLCLKEKYHLFFNPDNCKINDRNKFFNIWKAQVTKTDTN